MSDLPAGIELSKLAGLGLADLEDKLANFEKNTNSCIGRLVVDLCVCKEKLAHIIENSFLKIA